MVRTSVAGFLSLILPGAGSYYLGKVRTALACLLLETLGSLLLALLWYLEFLPGFVTLLAIAALTVLTHVGGAVVAAVEAYRGSDKRPFWQALCYLLLAALALLLMQNLSRSQLMAVYAVATIAMEPTLEHGDRVLMRPRPADHNYRRGQLVSLLDPEKNESFVRRLIGVGGDRVTIHNSEVTVNGEKLRTGHCAWGEDCFVEVSSDGLSYLTVDRMGQGTMDLQVEVPAGRIFVMRDRRDMSQPLNALPTEWLQGEVADVWWSYTHDGVQVERIGISVAPLEVSQP